MSSTFRVEVGAVVKIEEELFELRQVTGNRVVVGAISNGTTRTMTLIEFLNAARHPKHSATDRMSIGLQIATQREREEVQLRRQLLQWVDNPQDAEGLEMTTKQRVVHACGQLNISERTFHRMKRRFVDEGEEGLVRGVVTRSRNKRVDPEWEQVATNYLSENVNSSTIPRSVVIDEVSARVRSDFPEASIPSQSTCYEILAKLNRGREHFGSAKARRSIARSPHGVHGKLHATRPGEFIATDTNTLDILVRTPRDRRCNDIVSRPELTVAMDVYTRSIVAITLATTTTQDTVSAVLFEACQPVPWPGQIPENSRWNFLGVPEEVLVMEPRDHWNMPYCPPEGLITDRGKPFVSAHVRSVCTKLGISLHLSQPYKPTDKGWIERFFRTLNDSLISRLPGYVGKNVDARGENAERLAMLEIGEIELVIREWVSSIYHTTRQSGLILPEAPTRHLSPAEMYQASIHVHGLPRLLLQPEDVFDFLVTEERTIQRKGVTVDNRTYDGKSLDQYRLAESNEPRVSMKTKFRFKVDPRDVRFIYFQDPKSFSWHRLEWTEAKRIGRPFSIDEYDAIRDLDLKEFPDRRALEHKLAARVSGDKQQPRKAKNRARRIIQRLPTPAERMAEAREDWTPESVIPADRRPIPDVEFPDPETQPAELDSFEVDMGWTGTTGALSFDDELEGDTDG